MPNQTYDGGADVPSPLRASGKQPRELTGWMVLGLLVAFFAVIFGMNAFMAREAISTFGGVETESAYRAGQTFERDMAMAKAQDAQHWQVDAKVTPAAGGGVVLEIVARDAAGAPLTGLVATAIFARPTDRRLDRTITASESGPGHFQSSGADVPAGQWDLVIDLSRQGQRVFRSKNRVVVR
jgi:nitrogen fixation protein FixH